jgi:hypothetical protein
VLAVPAQLFGALTFPPPDFVQLPVQLRFVWLLYPQAPVLQDVPISEHDRVPHFLIETLVEHAFTQFDVPLIEPHVFVVAHVWLAVLLVTHAPPHALLYVP